MTDAANGTRAMPMRKRMFSHTRVRFTRTTKWNTWWLANQYTPRTMKLMKNAANRDHKSPRSPARPPGPTVSGARTSRTRIVIAIAKTPSISVSSRFFGNPRAIGLPDSVVLPRVRHMERDFKTSAFAMRPGMTFNRGVVASSPAVHRDQVLDISNEAPRGHVVLRVPEERTSQRCGYGAHSDEREEPDRFPVRTLHRQPEARAGRYLLRVLVSEGQWARPDPIRIRFESRTGADD